MIANMRVLVVDDQSEIRDSLAEILTDEGYEVRNAGHVEEAVAIAGEGIDLALVDIKLGDESGMDLLSGHRGSSRAFQTRKCLSATWFMQG